MQRRTPGCARAARERQRLESAQPPARSSIDIPPAVIARPSPPPLAAAGVEAGGRGATWSQLEYFASWGSDLTRCGVTAAGSRARVRASVCGFGAGRTRLRVRRRGSVSECAFGGLLASL